MFEDIFNRASEIITLKDGKEYKIEGIKEYIIDLLQGSYTSPSFANGKSAPLDEIMQKDIWIIAKFEPVTIMSEDKCDEIFFVLKPKYDFINFYKKLNGEVLNKVTLCNLAKYTNRTINYINDKVKEMTK